MCPLGFKNKELYETLTSIITNHRDGDYESINEILLRETTLELISTSFLEHLVKEIPELFIDSLIDQDADKEEIIFAQYQEKLEKISKYLFNTFFNKNFLPFTIVRIIELVYHPFSIFQKTEFSKFVKALETCSYVTMQFSSTQKAIMVKEQIENNGKIDKQHIVVNNKKGLIISKKRKRDCGIQEETESCKKPFIEKDKSSILNITPSLMKIPWLTIKQIQQASAFSKEIESIMAINFGYDDEDEDEDEDDDEDDEDGGELSDHTFVKGNLEKKLKKDIKNRGEVIVEEYEEMDGEDDDWSPEGQEDAIDDDDEDDDEDDDDDDDGEDDDNDDDDDDVENDQTA